MIYIDRTPLVIKLLLLCLLGALSHGAHAQNEGRWYSVEIIVFKRLNNASLTEEFWAQDLSLQYPNSLQYLSEKTTSDTGSRQNFKRLSSNVFRLNNYRNSLNSSEDYEVLYHQAWKQQMQGKNRSPSIAIRGGDLITNSNSQSHSELEGYITFHIARFLHLNTNLWLSEPNIAKLQGASRVSPLPKPPLYGYVEERDLSQALKNDTAPTQALSERIGEILDRDARQLIEGASGSDDRNGLNSNTQARTKTSKGIIRLAQQRKMRSKELHYIDHPLMGMLIYVNPI